MSASFDPDWGEDILGKEFLYPGEVWQVGFNRGDDATCVWDVKVITIEGYEVKYPELNLCAITDVNVNN